MGLFSQPNTGLFGAHQSQMPQGGPFASNQGGMFSQINLEK